MLNAFLISISFSEYTTPDFQHVRYQGRLNPDAIEQIYRVVPFEDPNIIRANQLVRQRLAAEAKARAEAEKARRAARAQQQAEARRRAALQQTSVAGNTILAGIIDLKRLPETGPIDGCDKVNKGLIMGGGFMLFSCEKLLPHEPISKHETVFRQYNAALLKDGWRKLADSKTKDVNYKRSDGLGCEANLNLKLWTDRSMNQPPRPATDRNAHRQIVFLAKFYGKSCERYYPIVEALAAGN